MMKNCFVLMCCLIFNAVGSELTSNEENVHYSHGFNFYHKPTSDGKLAVIYNCSQHLQEVNKTANWGRDHLPEEMEFLTIQDCNLNLSIGWDYDVRENKELFNSLSSYKFPFFKQLVFKNITGLTIGPLIAGFQLVMKGNIIVSIEDVQLMKVLPTDFLNSTIITKKFQPNDVGSMHFIMKNVHIEEMQSNAFFWEAHRIPLTLELNNVTIKNIASGAIKLHHYNNKFPIGYRPSHPENQIFITNSTLDILPKQFIRGAAEDFNFTNNKVKVTETATLDIKAKNIEISNNELNYVKDFSFACIERGKNATFKFNSNKIQTSENNAFHFEVCDPADVKEKTSFHNNEFKCINSAWLRRNNFEKEKHLHSLECTRIYYFDYKICENVLFSGNNNICTDSEIKCLKSIQDFSHDYLNFRTKWDVYCNGLNSIGNTKLFIIFVILIIFGLGISGFIYIFYTEGTFSRCPFVRKRYDNQPQILITIAS